MKTKKTRNRTLLIICIGTGLIIATYFLQPETESQKVIRHYKKEQNKEKLAAARFLIDNMDGYYSYRGEAYEIFRNVYEQLGFVSEPERNGILKNKLDSLRFVKELSTVFDKDCIKAEFLIKHIDFAYNVWKKSPWNKDVSFDNFCEYILPYKYSNEGISEFIEPYNKIYSSILDHIYFGEGDRYKAINHNSLGVSGTNTKNDGPVVLFPDSNSLIFDNIECGKEGAKTLFIRYSNLKHWSKMRILINGKDTLYANLKPLKGLNDFPKRPLKLPVQFQRGQNTIEIAACDDTIAIDYIEIVPFEKYYRNDVNNKIVDGANYIIVNAANKKCLEIEKGSASNYALLCYNDYKGEEHQHFNVQNIDYGFFNLSPCHIESLSNCLDVAWGSKSNDTAIIMYNFNKQANQLWAIIPIGNEQYKIINRMSGKCLEISSTNNQIVQNEYIGSISQHWIFKRADDEIFFDKKFHIAQNSVLEATRRIADELDFDFLWFDTNIPELPALDILNTKIGNCAVESQFQLSVLRSLGIPAVIDFYPSGANSSVTHEFNSIIDKNNQPIYCQVGEIPGTGNVPMPTLSPQ